MTHMILPVTLIEYSVYVPLNNWVMVNQDYCLCDVESYPNKLFDNQSLSNWWKSRESCFPSHNKPLENHKCFINEVVPYSQKTYDEELYKFNNYNLANYRGLSKAELNLVKLSGFPYSVSLKHTGGTPKPITVYTCNFEGCGKEFSRTWNLIDHANFHTNVKPFNWRYCEKQFTQKGNLMKHERTHKAPLLNDRKRYKWDLCQSRYTERYNYMVG